MSMDAIVQQAMAKWPNVPHCYGWLALDARGSWRMRDDHAQAEGLPGDRIRHPALIAFIQRNYACDERGCWFFQNGPQRVYVNLDATPYIARSDPEHGFLLHTGEPVQTIESVWMTSEGELILEVKGSAAMLDDRDVASCLGMLQQNGKPVDDESLMAWLSDIQVHSALTWNWNRAELKVQRIERANLPAQFGFVSDPESLGRSVTD